MPTPAIPSFNVQDLMRMVQMVDQLSIENDMQRIAIVDTLHEMLARLETPWETAFRIICTQPAQAASLKICHDVGLFCRWAESFPDTAVRDTDICELVDGDQDLFARVLRHLSATKIIKQVKPGHYALTEFSRSLGASELANIIPYLYNTALPGFTNLPTFLQSTKYCTPNDRNQTNWHHMRGVSRFDELKRNSADMESFQAVMKSIAATKPFFTDLIPVAELLPTDKIEGVLLVDVGGGFGHDIVRFQSELLQEQIQLYPGALVLQDIAHIAHNRHVADVESAIVSMQHDFFDEQPVKGALLYYLHTVLHDWTDRDAVRILSRLAAAAQPEYSRILIHETILLTEKPSVSSTSQDMQMMMVLSSRERTELEWYKIIAEAGLVVQKVWSSPGHMESIIELMKPRSKME